MVQKIIENWQLRIENGTAGLNVSLERALDLPGFFNLWGLREGGERVPMEQPEKIDNWQLTIQQPALTDKLTIDKALDLPGFF